MSELSSMPNFIKYLTKHWRRATREDNAVLEHLDKKDLASSTNSVILNINIYCNNYVS